MNVPKGYKMTEVGLIPEDWEVKKLGDIAEMASGGTPLTSNPNYYNGDIPWVSISDMTKGGKHIFATDKYITQLGFNNSACKIFPIGTVLYAMYASLGECSIAGIPLCSSQAILGIRVKENLDNEFLYYYLNYIKNTVKGYGQQGTQPNLNKEIVQNFQIKLPFIDEQRSIARVLSDTDELINALDKLIAKKRDIKKAVMQELLTGKTRLPGFSGKWEVKKLGELFDITAGKDLIRSQYSEVASDSFPFPIYANSLSNFGLYGYSSIAQNQAGCITVTARGTLGYACYRISPFVAIGRLLVLTPKVRLDGFFISELINHSIEFASESTGVPQLTSPQLSKCDLSIPSPEEQVAIAQVLSDMDREITALEQRRDKTEAIKQGMMQELLTGRIRLH